MKPFVADTSAFVAIHRNEKMAEVCLQTITAARSVIVPGSCLVEAALLTRVGQDLHSWLTDLIAKAKFQRADISLPVIEIAVDAARRYGKGSGHPAQLNFGDCLVYAVAKYRDLPLLFVGDDFTHTDITPAIPVAP